MKKIITAFLIILCLTAANVYADDITVIMDGEEMSFDQPPVIMNDSTLVPFRAIFERLGMEVEWDSTDKS
ncbi:MAG: copper amine oxidase, partial [Clostridia bacterium]|nr:copper amine oxidase [Clostridia bacterium]